MSLMFTRRLFAVVNDFSRFRVDDVLVVAVIFPVFDLFATVWLALLGLVAWLAWPV